MKAVLHKSLPPSPSKVPSPTNLRLKAIQHPVCMIQVIREVLAYSSRSRSCGVIRFQRVCFKRNLSSLLARLGNAPQILQAYETLGDPLLRQKYDMSGMKEVPCTGSSSIEVQNSVYPRRQ